MEQLYRAWPATARNATERVSALRNACLLAGKELK
jgi:hypothetical protein